MYKLYAIPQTYAIGAHLLLEESGVAYTIIDPNLDPVSTDVAFLQASPHARVPALELPDGSSLCESGAIALFLADSLANGKFNIDKDSPSRPKYLQWLFYLSSTLQPEVMLQFHPEHYFDDDKMRVALSSASMDRLDKIWEILNAAYANKIWLFDKRPTAIDFSLATVLLWPECFRNGVSAYPNLQAMLSALAERDAFKIVMQWHIRNKLSS